MGRFCYFSCDTTARGHDILATMVESARRVGVTEDIHVFSHRDVPGAISHRAGPIDIKFHTFKWRLLKDRMKEMGYDYYVWLDSDTFFVRHPGNLEESLLRGNRIWALMESNMAGPGVRYPDWWGIKIPDLIKLFRNHGAGETVWNSNGGMWIVRHEYIDEFVHETDHFHRMCLQAGYKDVHDELPLAWIGQVQPWVADPVRNCTVAVRDIWACDWQGTFSDRLPDGYTWDIIDYMTGARRPGNPAIVHAMRSKMAMARGMNFTPDDITVPDEVTEAMEKAAKTGRWMASVWRIEDGKIHLQHFTNNYPRADMLEAGKMLGKELQVKSGGLIKPVSAPKSTEIVEENPHGVGTLLAATFKRFGFDASKKPEMNEQVSESDALRIVSGAMKIEGCGSCRQLMAAMDRGGPDWCEKNFDSLVVQIGSNASKWPVAVFGTVDKIPFFTTIVSRLLRSAIERARHFETIRKQELEPVA